EDCGYLLFIGCYSFVAHGRWRPFCDKRLNFGKVLNWARHSVVTRGTGFKRSAQAAARGTPPARFQTSSRNRSIYGMIRVTLLINTHVFIKEADLNSELSHLISLQDVDVEIKRLKVEIDSFPTRRDELERQFAESVKEYLTIKQELDDAQAERRRIETDL